MHRTRNTFAAKYFYLNDCVDASVSFDIKTIFPGEVIPIVRIIGGAVLSF